MEEKLSWPPTTSIFGPSWRAKSGWQSFHDSCSCRVWSSRGRTGKVVELRLDWASMKVYNDFKPRYSDFVGMYTPLHPIVPTESYCDPSPIYKLTRDLCHLPALPDRMRLFPAPCPKEQREPILPMRLLNIKDFYSSVSQLAPFFCMIRTRIRGRRFNPSLSTIDLKVTRSFSTLYSPRQAI